MKAFIIDLDGVIYEGNNLLEGSKELIAELKLRNIRPIFCTNNSGKTSLEICDKLNVLGIQTEVDHVFSASSCSGEYLKSHGIHSVYPIGTESLRQELESSRLTITESEPQAILAGLKPDFSYQDLSKAMSVYFASANCKIFACNLDSNYPADGQLKPGCGPLVSALLSATEGQISGIVGKPEKFMLDQIFQRFALKKEDVLIIGDTYTSDIEMAKRANCRAVWITRKAPPSRRKDLEVTISPSLTHLLGQIEEGLVIDFS